MINTIIGYKQTGVALITVLLVIALASVVAVRFTQQQQMTIQRSELLLHWQQAKHYALGAERWAMAILLRDRNNNDTDHEGEAWAATVPTLPVTGGQLSGGVSDLQARFNLNNLLAQDGQVDDLWLQILRRLLAQLDLSEDIALAIADWVDQDRLQRFPDGAEDSDYLLATPPYLAANQVFADISELRLIKGIDASIYEALVPYVCALPSMTAINVNTASAELIAALDVGLDISNAQRLVELREQNEFSTIDEFLTALLLPEHTIRESDISVSSDYFLFDAEVQIGVADVTLQSVLNRDNATTLQRNYAPQLLSPQ